MSAAEARRFIAEQSLLRDSSIQQKAWNGTSDRFPRHQQHVNCFSPPLSADRSFAKKEKRILELFFLFHYFLIKQYS